MNLAQEPNPNTLEPGSANITTLRQTNSVSCVQRYCNVQ